MAIFRKNEHKSFLLHLDILTIKKTKHVYMQESIAFLYHGTWDIHIYDKNTTMKYIAELRRGDLFIFWCDFLLLR